MSDELERIWKELVVVESGTIHLQESTEENRFRIIGVPAEIRTLNTQL
jgi:hypothetical protein